MISGGRVELGIGYGWNVEEMANHGLNYKKRREILREHMLLMIELWTKEEATFKGEYVKFEKSWAWPKPTQKPYPPILMGGAAGPKTAAAVAEFCTGWMPIGGMHNFDGGMKEITKACEAIGRDPKSLDIGMFYAMAPDMSEIKTLPEKGVSRAILPLPPAPASTVLPLIDECAKFI